MSLALVGIRASRSGRLLVGELGLSFCHFGGGGEDREVGLEGSEVD
jgi:hypothetical protein